MVETESVVGASSAIVGYLSQNGLACYARETKNVSLKKKKKRIINVFRQDNL